MAEDKKNKKKTNSKKQTETKPKHSVSASKNNKKSSKGKSNKNTTDKKKTVEKNNKQNDKKTQNKENKESKTVSEEVKNSNKIKEKKEIKNDNKIEENKEAININDNKEKKDNKNINEINESIDKAQQNSDNENLKKSIESKENVNNKKQNDDKDKLLESKQKSNRNKKGAHESINESNGLFTFKEKFNEDKPESQSNKEKRMQKLEELRATKKRKKRIKIVVATVAAVYVVGCILFSFVCFPRTLVADTDLSFQTKNFMKKSLIPNAGEYVFMVDGLDFDLEIDGKTIDYNFDIDKVVDRVIEIKNPLLWPFEIFRVHDFMSESVVSYNKEAAINIAVSEIQNHNQTATRPVDANLVCNPATKEISIKDEVIGNCLDPDKALASILGYIGSGRRHLECGKNEQLVPTLYAEDERCEQAIKQGKVLIESVLTMMMGQAPVSTLNFNTWVSWLKLKPGYVAGLDDDMLNAWAQCLAGQCDTVGKPRTFVTPYGKTCTVDGGDDIGWKIDQAQLIALVAEQAPLGKVQTLSVPCSSTANGYAGPGQRDWGARYIDVDLSEQMARMYDDAGNMIWSSSIVSGKPGKDTPQGVYTIKQKSSPSTLIGAPDPVTGQPEYRTVVQYWMPFLGNMVGFHDATWQPDFGGDLYLTIGSHGCVNLSYASAQSLYACCVTGDIVVVHK